MDPYLGLARLSILQFVTQGTPLEQIPEEIQRALAPIRAAVFVSIHTREHALRGCIGTLEPLCPNIAEEIIRNSISACSADWRFAPVTSHELPNLILQVDVLSPLEAVEDATSLDPKHYGLLISASDGRRGVLLPDLEGIDTPQAQIAIACRKAGIDPRQDPIQFQRFTTERHAEV